MFLCGLDNLVQSNNEDGKPLDKIEWQQTIRFFDYNHVEIDLANDLFESRRTYDVEKNQYVLGQGQLKAIRYIMHCLFHDYKNIERQHLLAHAYILLRRAVKWQGAKFPVSKINSVVCGSLIVSQKILDDAYLSNQYWAKVLHPVKSSDLKQPTYSNLLRDETAYDYYNLTNLNDIESEFLNLCKFDIFVQTIVLDQAEAFLYKLLTVDTTILSCPICYEPMIVQ